MILERFNAISFIGDEVVQSIYTAFNILLREDLALGGLRSWNMDEQDQEACKCDSQFLNSYCSGFAVKSSEEVKENEAGDWKGSSSYCAREYLFS
jgi:hypothetical protein